MPTAAVLAPDEKGWPITQKRSPDRIFSEFEPRGKYFFSASLKVPKNAASPGASAEKWHRRVCKKNELEKHTSQDQLLHLLHQPGGLWEHCGHIHRLPEIKLLPLFGIRRVGRANVENSPSGSRIRGCFF